MYNSETDTSAVAKADLEPGPALFPEHDQLIIAEIAVTRLAVPLRRFATRSWLSVG